MKLPSNAPRPQPSVTVTLGTGFWPLPTQEVPKPHPYFVIAGPVNGNVLAVNVTDLASFQFKVERLCVIRANEHPSITKDSAANFLPNKPWAVSIATLSALLATAPNSGIRHIADLSRPLVERLRQGARDSAEMDPQLRKKYGLS